MRLLNTLSIIIALLTWNDVGASQWWNGWSLNDNNDRYQREPIPVAPTTTKTQFNQLWYTEVDGIVRTNPTVYEDYVYAATWTGTFYCLRANNGIILWQRNLSDIINNGYVYISRTSPLVYNNMIILGLTDARLFSPVLGSDAYVIAFDRFTGVLRWKKSVSPHPASIITSTPRLANDHLFIGISSKEEYGTIDLTYPCCTFQGSVVALNANTGTFLWETKMIPDNNGTTTGYSGASVWGSQFPVDYKRNQIYIGTGNFYKLPPLIQKCLNETSNLTLYSDPCDQPGAYSQAIVALDMSTGIVRWHQNIGPINAWTNACNEPTPNVNCPPYPGPDTDFGQAPILKLDLRYKFGGKARDQLFVGQKSGIAFGIDAETGKIIWSNQVAPGSHSGGMQFGSAADDQYLYVGNNNADSLNYTLPDGTITSKASWSALDLVTGDLKWTTVDPTTNIGKTSAYCPLTVWDQLVLVQGGSSWPADGIELKGCLYGLNKTNGQVLYEWCMENMVITSGASVAMNTIYLGIQVSDAVKGGIVALQLPGYDGINAATTSAFSRKILLFFLCFLLF